MRGNSSRKLYNVALTESPDARTHHWQTRSTDSADGYIGSAELGNARVYVANGVVATSERDARAHALQMWIDETRSHNPQMTVPLPQVQLTLM